MMGARTNPKGKIMMSIHTYGDEYGFQTRAVHTGNDVDRETGAIRRPIIMATATSCPMILRT